MKHHPYLIALSLPLLCACSALVARVQPAPRVRVLTFNIHHGEGSDGRMDLDRVAATIRAAAPDLVSIQEVDQRTMRSEAVLQGDELIRLLDMYGEFASNLDYQGGEYGLVLLSRWPILDIHHTLLPGHTGREPRGVLGARVDHPAGPFHFLATHFDHGADLGPRLASVAWLREWVGERRGEGAILAGDLNDEAGSQVLLDLRRDWMLATGGALSYPAARPVRAIDHILARPGSRWAIVESFALEEQTASDHLPVLAVFDYYPD